MFVSDGSIVKEIWRKPDTLLFIFAGAAAEFAVNKAVDWLFFTGRLPEDPLGRLFTTVGYSQKIVFSDINDAHRAIGSIVAIHGEVETKRGFRIPAWAYRDVLYMLIDYSIRSYEILYRKLSIAEKHEVFNVFYRVGKRMKIEDLPTTYDLWLISRQQHLEADLANSDFTIKLFKQYKLHLGIVRYFILVQTQSLLVPQHVRELLHLQPTVPMKVIIAFYKKSIPLKLDRSIRALILPKKYMKELIELETRAISR